MSKDMTIKPKGTAGVSPKVLNPAIVGLAAGILVLLLVDKDVGLTIILAALGLPAVGAVSGPGRVVVPTVPQDPNDMRRNVVPVPGEIIEPQSGADPYRGG